MEQVFSKMVDSMSATVQANLPNSGRYVGDDGLLHCAVCHKATQVRINLFGTEKIVTCICDCVQKRIDEEERQMRMAEYDRRRRECFAESNMHGWTFANDDRKNARISDAMKRYADNFPEFKAQGKGLLLYGTVGTGKTFYAACIANRLIDDGYRVLMTNFARLTNIIQGKFDGRQEFIDSLNRYALLVIDDLGAERKSEFMQETVFNIIDARYRSGLPFIVTTNLTADEIKQPQEVSFSRIYDRVLERCHPVEVAGVSRRRRSVKESYFDMQNKLGL